tara:strand:- start:1412 stop:1699 length:288 start_codon:yes stop_codon:yes gene_type:complete
LAQTFIILPPVRNPTPFLLELVPPRVIEFVRHRLYPIDHESAVITEPAGFVQQRRVKVSSDMAVIPNCTGLSVEVFGVLVHVAKKHVRKTGRFLT